jgi:signal recognition particle GTPase
MNSYQSQLNSFQEKENERQEIIKRTQEEINLKTSENNKVFIENIKEDIKNELDIYISKQLKDFPYLSPKEILSNIIIKEKIEEKNIFKLKEKFNLLITENISSNQKHFNILVLGPSGCGKSTLINSLLKLEGQNSSPESIGKPCTKKQKLMKVLK